LQAILTAVLGARSEQPRRPPLLLKLSPDLDDGQLDDALDAATGVGIDGVIATNTTIARHPSLVSPSSSERGGLSGLALRERSTEVVAEIHRRTAGKLTIIGVGGVFDVDDVKAKLDAGATLVQLYTGLIYEGPRLVRRLVHALASA
jgi:dihydroorotate dehydrogenase